LKSLTERLRRLRPKKAKVYLAHRRSQRYSAVAFLSKACPKVWNGVQPVAILAQKAVIAARHRPSVRDPQPMGKADYKKQQSCFRCIATQGVSYAVGNTRYALQFLDTAAQAFMETMMTLQSFSEGLYENIPKGSQILLGNALVRIIRALRLDYTDKRGRYRLANVLRSASYAARKMRESPVSTKAL